MASETIVYPAGNISKAYKYQTFDTTQTINGHSYNCLLISDPKSTFPSGEYINPIKPSGTNHRHYYLDLSPYFSSISYITWDSHLLYPSSSTWYIIHSTASESGNPSSLKLRVGFTTSTSWPATITQDGGVWTESIDQSGSGTRNMIYQSLTTSSYKKLSESNIWDSYTRTNKKYLHFRMWNGLSVGVVQLYGVAIYGMAPNTTPEPPIIVWPANIASPTTYNHRPWFKAQCGVDADNDNQTIQYKIGDTGTYTAMNTTGLQNTQTIEKQHSTTLSDGAYTIYMRSYDGTAYSSEVSRTFYVATAVHDPTDLGVGKKIELRNLTKMKDQITTQRKYYGITNDFLTTKNIGDKITAGGGSLDELRTALSACKCPTIGTMPGTGTKAAFADSINVLLTSLGNA